MTTKSAHQTIFIVAVLLGILIVLACDAVAQEPKARKFKVDAFDIAWAGTIVGDKLSTERALARCTGCRELSPLGNTKTRIGFQLGMLGAVKAIEFYHPSHSTLFRVFKGSMIAIGTGAIIHNLRK